MLLRISYACLSGLPIDKLEVPYICNALVPYFVHEATMIQISARNAAQFLIPCLESSAMQNFILSSKNVHDFIRASGKDMPVISSLKLLLSYCQLAANSMLFFKEGLVYYLLSIMFNQSSREDEKLMAVSVMKMLSFHYHKGTIDSEAGDTIKTSTITKSVLVQPNQSTCGVKIDMVAEQDLPQLLHHLDKQAKAFVAACSRTIINQSVLKETFESFSLLLSKVQNNYVITTHDPDILMSNNVSSTLLNVVATLFKGKLPRLFLN